MKDIFECGRMLKTQQQASYKNTISIAKTLREDEESSFFQGCRSAISIVFGFNLGLSADSVQSSCDIFVFDIAL